MRCRGLLLLLLPACAAFVARLPKMSSWLSALASSGLQAQPRPRPRPTPAPPPPTTTTTTPAAIPSPYRAPSAVVADHVRQSEHFLDLLGSGVVHPTTEIVLVLVGIPGCGKSTFAKQIVNAAPEGSWCVACQDVEGDRKKVERLVADVLEGKSERSCAGAARVIVDRCNFDALQRKHWIDLASRRLQTLGRKSPTLADAATENDSGPDPGPGPDRPSPKPLLKLCIVLPRPADVAFCTARAKSRGNDGVHEGDEDWAFIVSRMAVQFRPPQRAEGFDAIYWCSSQEELDLVGSVVAQLPSH